MPDINNAERQAINDFRAWHDWCSTYAISIRLGDEHVYFAP